MFGSTRSQFDDLSSLYEDMVSWPFRKEIETPSVLETLGDVRGKDVLDFGCGDGTYSRILKRLGARRVVGFDVAEGMLAHGQQRESENPLGIEYTNELSESLNGQFDLVLSVYVMPYARRKPELDRMCANMARVLRQGGRLVTLAGFTHINHKNPVPAQYVDIGKAPAFLVPYLKRPHAVILEAS